jgi:preprotein translocase subunit SecG
MNIVMNLVLGLQILTALAMIGLVLLQHGKGADMGASFGSGASGSLFGATGSANFLSRSTAACAAIFFVCTLYLAYSANDRPKPTSGSILDRPAAAASAPLLGASGAMAIPGPASGAVALRAPAPPATASAVPSTPTSASGAGAIPQK